MARFWCVFVFVVCLFAYVEAFPKARRSKAEKAFVVYRMPSSRCVDLPQNPICDFGYKVRYYNASLLTPLSTVKGLLSTIGIPDKCIQLIMKLSCRNMFPECLPNGLLDYGDQHGLIDEIGKCQPLLKYAYLKANFSTGIHKDPYASHQTLNCANIPRDPGNKCPKPQYAMPLSQVKYYYGKVKNVSEQLATVQPPMPSECKKKALNVLGCSYVFCSSDKTALLFKTSRSDCEGIGKCLERHQALDEAAEKSLAETCPHFPSPGDYEQVDLPY